MDKTDISGRYFVREDIEQGIHDITVSGQVCPMCGGEREYPSSRPCRFCGSQMVPGINVVEPEPDGLGKFIELPEDSGGGQDK